MVELFIDDVRFPLYDAKVTVTKQINNVAELKDRQSTFTNRFKAAKTPETVAAFNNLGIVGNLSRSPYKVLKSKLVYNGVEVLEDGNAYIDGDNDGYFSIAIYDGNIFFFQEIGNTKLNELDFNDLTHELNPANYVASFPNTEGYIYAVSDNGQFTPTASPEGIQINYQLPAVFVSTVWQKIFELTQFTYSGDIFTSEKFKALVISMKRGYNSELDTITIPVQLHYTGISDDITYLVEEEDIVGIPTYTWSAGWNLSFLDNQGILNNGILSIVEDSQYTMNWNIDLTNVPEDSTVTVKIRETTGGGTVYEETEINVNGAFNTLDSVTFTALAGEHYNFTISITGTSIFTNPYNVITNVSGNWHMVDTSSTVISINISSFIGDMLVKNFIKDIMQHFGLMLQLNEYTKDYEFVKMQDLLIDVENADDYSDKFIRTTKTTYQLKGYAQKNRFAYNYFNADRVRFADGFLNVDNENLTPEKTLLTRPYNACEISKSLLNANVVTLCPFWEAERDDDGVILKYKPIANKNYIAEIRRIYEEITYNVTDGVGIAFEGDVPRLDFSNLNYTKLVEENYSNLEDSLDWNNVQDIELRLTAKEVKEFNFFKLIHIKQLSSNFYVNKTSYSGDAFAKAQIVKVAIPSVIGDITAGISANGALSSIGTKYFTTLNGIASTGGIDTYLWELVSAPATGTVIIDDSAAVSTKVEFNNVVGTWTFKLTVSNSVTQSEKTILITTT